MNSQANSIHKVLKERKNKQKKIKKYRIGRIHNRFNRQKKQFQNNQIHVQNTQQATRKIQYYNQIFKDQQNQKHPTKERISQRTVQKESQLKQQSYGHQQRLQNYNRKQRKYVAKMKRQRTNRGQPIMRNYVKYALSTIEKKLYEENVEKKTNNLQKKDKNKLKKNYKIKANA